MPKADFLNQALLDHIFKNIAMFSTLANVWVSLHTADPTAGNEVSGGSYVRKQQAASTWTRTGNQIVNNSAVTFVEATADWGSITYFGINNASSGGSMLYYAPLTTPRTILTGDIGEFSPGQLTVTET
jgi:hypothetical protein